MPYADNSTIYEQRLKSSYGGGVVITIILMLSYFCISLTGKIAAMFLSAAMLDFQITQDFSLDYIVAAVVGIILAVFLLLPLQLNIKSWYQHSTAESPPITAAFTYFANLKKYFAAVKFTVLKLSIILLVFILSLSPSIILTGVMKYAVNGGEYTLGMSFGAIFVISTILALLGLFPAIYFSAGFFFADYLFIKGIETRPLCALRISMRYARKNKKSLFLALSIIFFYYLSCIFIVTIPFVLPKIRAKLANYVDGLM